MEHPHGRRLAHRSRAGCGSLDSTLDPSLSKGGRDKHNRYIRERKGRSNLIMLTLWSRYVPDVCLRRDWQSRSLCPAIAKDLGFAVAGAAWVIDVYSLAFTCAPLHQARLRYTASVVVAPCLPATPCFPRPSIACALGDQRPQLLDCAVVQGVLLWPIASSSCWISNRRHR